MKLLNKIFELMEELGRVRAASHLTRLGLHEAAKDLMSK
jgi:hypothetical protein